MTQPLVSVIVPTKNSATTLAACLRSITEQTYPAIELIVVDNSSSDATEAIAREYTEHFYIHGPERSWQRNYGVEQAQGEYVAMIDSDMELDPTVIADCVAAAQEAGVTGVVIPEESFGEGFWAKCKQLERSFYVGVPWMEAARFFPRSLYRQLGGYDTTLVSGEDWDLSRRAGEQGSISRVGSFIHHNEGQLRLWQTLQKKYYYAARAKAYLAKHPTKSKLTDQVGPLERYKLFLSQPKRLFARPMLGMAMLFMKTAEFGAGAFGYFLVRSEHRA
jgi:glycosyltransferase involved in cell wall biosynthesis